MHQNHKILNNPQSFIPYPIEINQELQSNNRINTKEIEIKVKSTPTTTLNNTTISNTTGITGINSTTQNSKQNSGNNSNNTNNNLLKSNITDSILHIESTNKKNDLGKEFLLKQNKLMEEMMNLKNDIQFVLENKTKSKVNYLNYFIS